MLNPRNKHLLAVDDVAVAFARGEGFGFGCVGSGGRFSDGERLQAQFSGGDFRQVLLFLRVRTVPQQRAHNVHLRVARAGIRAGTIDLFKNDGSFRHAESAAAVFLWNQRGQATCFGQCADELFRVSRLRLDRLPVPAVESAAQFTHRLAIKFVVLSVWIDVCHGGAESGIKRCRQQRIEVLKVWASPV